MKIIVSCLTVSVTLMSLNAAWAAVYTVDRTDDSAAATGCDDGTANDCSLRGAVIKANLDATVDEVIVPASATPYDVTIPNGLEGFGNAANDETVGDIDITKPLKVTGAGANQTTVRVTGTGDDRIFHVPTDTGGGVEISGLTLTGGNPAGRGGAFQAFGTDNDVTIRNCHLQGNTATEGGGAAIEVGGTHMIVNTTFSGNTADGRGGGLFFESGDLFVTNSTFFENTAVGDGTNATGGGGIDVSTGNATIINVSVVRNTVSTAGSIGAGIRDAVGAPFTFKIKNTLLFLNAVSGVAANCGLAPGSTAPVSQGHNSSNDASCTATFFTNASDLNIDGADTELALADNGGTVPTLFLPNGSFAIDVIASADCTDQNGDPLSTDQRGAKRPADGDFDLTTAASCDIGAIEVGCGNGIVEDEACDDGNLTSGDGCSSACAEEGGGTGTGGSGTGDEDEGGGCGLIRP